MGGIDIDLEWVLLADNVVLYGVLDQGEYAQYRQIPKQVRGIRLDGEE